MAIRIKSIESVDSKELSSESSMTPATKEMALEGIRNDFALVNKLIGEKHKCLDAWLSACLSNASSDQLRELSECYFRSSELLKKHCDSMERTCSIISGEAMDAAYKRENATMSDRPVENTKAVPAHCSGSKLKLTIESAKATEERKGV